MKNKIYGWQKVYGFSMKQRLKGKGFKIAIAVLFVITLLSLPVMSIIGGNNDAVKNSPIATVYVNDNGSKLALVMSKVLNESESFKNVKVKEVTDDSKLKELENNKSDDIYMEITIENGVKYSAYYGDSDNVSKGDTQDLADYIVEHSNELIMYGKGLDTKTVEALSMEYTSEVNTVKSGNDGMVLVEDSEGLGADEYGFSYGLLMVLLLLIMIGSSSVADAVVTEKSTRVIEYLLINIKPMAIVFGKILGAVTTVLIELLALVAGFAGSVVINGLVFPAADGSFAMPGMVESFLNGGMFAKTNAAGIVLAVLIFLLGVVFYGFIAGIAGASVSRVEDTQEGMKLFTMVSIIGAYLALFLIITESTSGSNFGAFTYVVYLLPLSAPFIMPEYLILGKVSIAIGAASLGIMLVGIVLMLMLVSNIYGALIYHRGAPLKIKDIIGITKQERGHK